MRPTTASCTPSRPGTARSRPASASRKATNGTENAARLSGERVLRRYSQEGSGPREVIVRPGAGGRRLVIDRDLIAGGQQRLLARLEADEPLANALAVCTHYLGAPADSRRCRPPVTADELPAPAPATKSDARQEWCVQAMGFVHSLGPLPCAMSIPELRWTRVCVDGPGEPTTVSLRSVIALLESYEPVCDQSRQAIGRYADDPAVSITVLRTELARVLRSPIVLNRGLREAVLARVGREATTMSEIASRCGRLKRDAKGNRSGETSWLARRIGLLPEGGQRAPTPWVHSDVLALIARDGLGIAPREVELG
jgi:hypothetical protein